MNREIGVRVIIVLLVAFMLGAVGVSWLRQHGIEGDENAIRLNVSDKLVKQWIAAVENNEKGKAIAIAKRFVADYEVEFPELDYLRIFKGNNITSSFLTDNLNDVDFLRWYEALYFKKIAESLAKKNDRVLESLMSMLVKRVKYKKVESGKYPPLSLVEIWERGYGNSYDRIRVMIELARQLGFNTKVGAIADPKTGRFIHMLCELEKEGICYVMDLSTGYLWKDRQVAELAQVPNRLPRQWPARLKKLVAKPVMLVPAEIQDYRRINNILVKRLKKYTLNPDVLPVFGRLPKQELDQYANKNVGRRVRLGYWQTPIIALYSIKPVCPKLWFYNDKKKKN